MQLFLQVRTYSKEFSTPNLIALSQPTSETLDSDMVTGKTHSIDLRTLNILLSKIDYTHIKQRKTLHNRLYHEAILSDEGGKGISFANMLVLLSHYTLIDDENALL